MSLGNPNNRLSSFNNGDEMRLRSQMIRWVLYLLTCGFVFTIGVALLVAATVWALLTITDNGLFVPLNKNGVVVLTMAKSSPTPTISPDLEEASTEMLPPEITLTPEPEVGVATATEEIWVAPNSSNSFALDGKYVLRGQSLSLQWDLKNFEKGEINLDDGKGFVTIAAKSADSNLETIHVGGRIPLYNIQRNRNIELRWQAINGKLYRSKATIYVSGCAINENAIHLNQNVLRRGQRAVLRITELVSNAQWVRLYEWEQGAGVGQWRFVQGLGTPGQALIEAQQTGVYILRALCRDGTYFETRQFQLTIVP